MSNRHPTRRMPGAHAVRPSSWSRLSALTAAVTVAVGLLAGGAGCKKKTEGAGGAGPSGGKHQSIQNIGSDTMVNLAQAWAEDYSKVEPGISVEVAGGGSGVGVAALINGTADIANCSRKLEPEEATKAKSHTGKDPKEFLVGYDGLAVYVHKNNPLEQISIEELSEIYREGGKIAKWSDLGVTELPGAKSTEIIRLSRQSNSGTYHYFRETVVGKKNDFRPGSMDMNGSKEVVEVVSKTVGAIGYSGLGYATAGVKILKVSQKKGEAAVFPSVPTVLDKTYPISRPMFMYTPGDPPEHVKKYLDWIHSAAGQAIVEKTGYVPLTNK
jgi:phosphate transport system substrate-binding protein